MFVVVGSLSAQAPAANEGTSGALKPAPVFSRGAATECSPGRKPGVGVVPERSPGGAKDSERLFRPSGAEILSKENPGLAPGATLCRRSGLYTSARRERNKECFYAYETWGDS